MTKPVAIVGTNPAALLAAYAAFLAGNDVVLLSKDDFSFQLDSSQFLRKPIESLTNEIPDGEIIYRTNGNVAEYKKKMYSDFTVERAPTKTSRSYVQNDLVIPAWNLEIIYPRLFSGAHPYITSIPNLDGKWLLENVNDFSDVIIAVPRPEICILPDDEYAPPHMFHQQNIVVSSEIQLAETNTIHYDGTDLHSWYKAGELFGNYFAEWSGINPPFHCFPDVKPVRTNCTCHPSALYVGRLGCWSWKATLDEIVPNVLNRLGAGDKS